MIEGLLIWDLENPIDLIFTLRSGCESRIQVEIMTRGRINAGCGILRVLDHSVVESIEELGFVSYCCANVQPGVETDSRKILSPKPF